MMYKASYIINSVLSCIFLIMGFYIITLAQKKNYIEVAIVSIFLIGTYSIFLWLDFICAKVFNHNKEQISISEKIKKQGKIIRVIVITLAIVVIILTFVAAASFYGYATKTMYRQLPFIILYLLMWLLSGVTAITNAVYFNKAVRENKNLVENRISNIGL